MKIFLLSVFISLSFTAKCQLPEFNIPATKDSIITNKNITHNYVVFLFLKKDCPYTLIYNKRIENLIAKYENILFINLGNHRLPTSNNLIQYHDKSKLIQYAFKAKKNPSAYFYKKTQGEFQLNYWGAIDDNPQLEDEVRHNFLNDAIEAVLEGKKYYFKESRPVGCNY